MKQANYYAKQDAKARKNRRAFHFVTDLIMLISIILAISLILSSYVIEALVAVVMNDGQIVAHETANVSAEILASRTKEAEMVVISQDERQDEVKKARKIVTRRAMAQATVKSTESECTAKEQIAKPEVSKNAYRGDILTPEAGRIQGPSGEETYYNLPMEGVLELMANEGFHATYWVRDDGVKMFGDYVMIASNLSIRPRGTLVETSLGMGIVCDTGSFAKHNSSQIDIAVNW